MGPVSYQQGAFGNVLMYGFNVVCKPIKFCMCIIKLNIYSSRMLAFIMVIIEMCGSSSQKRVPFVLSCVVNHNINKVVLNLRNIVYFMT